MSTLVAKFILTLVVNLGLALLAVHAIQGAVQIHTLLQTVTAFHP